MKPIFLTPKYLTNVWAGNRLTTIRGLFPPEGKAYGTCREVCAYKNVENIVATGAYAGRNVKELIAEKHSEFIGDLKTNALIRIAYIDPKEDLSLQVHPNEEYAVQVEQDKEKSESWYILDCAEDAYVVAGTTIEDKVKLRQAAEGETLEQYTKKIPVKKGDFVMIPAGMLHACGKNMLALEVGSFGGITYRLYDYGRGRDLHLDKGFSVLNPALQSEILHFPPGSRPQTGAKVQTAIRHPLFCTNIVDVKDEWHLEKDNRYMVLTVLEEDAVLCTEDEEIPLAYTRTVILPADLGEVTIKGSCRILMSWQPD